MLPPSLATRFFAYLLGDTVSSKIPRQRTRISTIPAWESASTPARCNLSLLGGNVCSLPARTDSKGPEVISDSNFAMLSFLTSFQLIRYGIILVMSCLILDSQ